MNKGQKKHNNSARNPEGDKSVREIAGIGPANESKLSKRGFDKVRQLVDKYRELQNDDTCFVDWLTHDIGLRRNHAKTCSSCIKGLSENSAEEVECKSLEMKIDEQKKVDISKLKASKYLKIMEGLKENIEKLLKEISEPEKNSSEERQPQFHGEKIFNPFNDTWEEYVKYAPRFSRQMSILFVRTDPFGTHIPIEYVMKYLGNPVEKKCSGGRRLWELIISNLGGTDYFHKHCYIINCSPVYFVGDFNPSVTSNEDAVADMFKSFDKLSESGSNNDAVKELITNIDCALIKAINLMNPELIIPIGECASKKVASLKIREDIQIESCVPQPSGDNVDITWMDTAWKILTKNAGREKKALDLANSVRTGATIAGLIYKDGVILGADTRDTDGRKILNDINQSKIHYITSNIYCRAEAAAQTDRTTSIIASNLSLANPSLRRPDTGHEKSTTVLTAEEMLKDYLSLTSQYQGYIGESPSTSKGHVKAIMVLGEIGHSKHSLSSITTSSSTEELEYFIIGSGSLAGVATLKAGYRKNMKREKAMILVRDALAGGIFNAIGSRSNVDLCIIPKDNKLEYLLPYHSVRVKYKKIMKRLRNELEESLPDELKEDGSLKMHITFGKKQNKKTIKYIFNPLKYAWSQHKEYIEKMPSKVNVLFVGMNPAPNAPSGIPFVDEMMTENIFEMNVSKTEWDEIPAFLRDKKQDKCPSAQRFQEFINYHFKDIKKFPNHCFVINVSPLFFVGTGKKNISLQEVPQVTNEVLKPLIDKSKQALKEAIELMKPKLIVTLGGYAKESVDKCKSEERRIEVISIEHPSPKNGKGKTDWIQYAEVQIGVQIDEAIGKAQ